MWTCGRGEANEERVVSYGIARLILHSPAEEIGERQIAYTRLAGERISRYLLSRARFQTMVPIVILLSAECYITFTQK